MQIYKLDLFQMKDNQKDSKNLLKDARGIENIRQWIFQIIGKLLGDLYM